MKCPLSHAPSIVLASLLICPFCQIAVAQTPSDGLSAINTNPHLPPSPTPLVVPRDPSPTKQIILHYTVTKKKVRTQIGPDGRPVEVPAYEQETKQLALSIDQNLDELELPPDAKRNAVLMVTAARHGDLLRALKEAKTPEEKEQAAAAMKENYTEHYAVETWWREQKLKELEAKLLALQEQVKQRTEAEEKYVTAAMTIASLHAEGIAIAPPKPSSPSLQKPPHAPAPRGLFNGALPPSTYQPPTR